MEMEFGSAMIGAIAIIICVIPLVIMSRNRKKREKVILQSLTEIANQYNCHIDQHEIFNGFAIGIDETQNFVFYYKRTNDGGVGEFADLSEIRSCEVLSTSSSFKNKNGNQKSIDRLELIFTPIAQNQPEIKMEFFNAEENMQLYGELQSIEKWSKRINDLL